MTHWSLLGRRVLAIGTTLAPLARGPLFGAAFELAGVERLVDLQPATVDLILIDADAADPAILGEAIAGLAAMAGARAPPQCQTSWAWARRVS